jgi:hypothetical protein
MKSTVVASERWGGATRQQNEVTGNTPKATAVAILIVGLCVLAWFLHAIRRRR